MGTLNFCLERVNCACHFCRSLNQVSSVKLIENILKQPDQMRGVFRFNNVTHTIPKYSTFYSWLCP